MCNLPLYPLWGGRGWRVLTPGEGGEYNRYMDLGENASLIREFPVGHALAAGSLATLLRRERGNVASSPDKSLK